MMMSASTMEVPRGRVSFRTGELRDTIPIATTLLGMKMNPLSVMNDPERFIVCEGGDGERIGFGQIRKIADTRESSETFDARPGSKRLDADADDEAWDDLERDWDSLPKSATGILLPWSEGYRQLQQRAELQRAKRRARVAQAEQEAEPLWELASVYVDDAWRGCGVGRALVTRLLERHASRGRMVGDTFLLTLAPTAGWYEQFGFRIVPKARVPEPMGLEVAAGEALSFVLGNELVCMRASKAPR